MDMQARGADGKDVVVVGRWAEGKGVAVVETTTDGGGDGSRHQSFEDEDETFLILGIFLF